MPMTRFFASMCAGDATGHELALRSQLGPPSRSQILALLLLLLLLEVGVLVVKLGSSGSPVALVQGPGPPPPPAAAAAEGEAACTHCPAMTSPDPAKLMASVGHNMGGVG